MHTTRTGISRARSCGQACSSKTRLFAVHEHLGARSQRQSVHGVLLPLILAHQVRRVVAVLGQYPHGAVDAPILRTAVARGMEGQGRSVDASEARLDGRDAISVRTHVLRYYRSIEHARVGVCMKAKFMVHRSSASVLYTLLTFSRLTTLQCSV